MRPATIVTTEAPHLDRPVMKTMADVVDQRRQMEMPKRK